MDEKPPCDRCRAACELYNRKPDCETCVPRLMPANMDAMRIWPVVRWQVVTAGMGQPVDIDHSSVWKAIEMYRVSDPLRCFESVVMLFHHFREKDGD